jgi:hypothetical protein
MFVVNLKIVIILYFLSNVQDYLGWGGGEQFWVWIERGPYLEVNLCICLDWQLYAELSGKPEMSFCFDKKVLKNPAEILYTACAFIRYFGQVFTWSLHRR